jgi:RHS repeat-associated protein
MQYGPKEELRVAALCADALPLAANPSPQKYASGDEHRASEKLAPWVFEEKTLHCFRAVEQLSGNLRWRCENSSAKTAARSAVTIDGATYTLDNAGNRNSKADLYAGVTTNYGYDNIYELLNATQGATTTENYTYDPVGNRLSDLTTSGWSNNTSNELTSRPGVSYTFDNNGNELTKVDSTGTTSYTWDYENRLTSVTLPGSGGTVSFSYDPFGRRIKKVSSAGTSVFAYDDDGNLIEETNASGGVVARYAQGLVIDEPLAMLRSGATSYYQVDGNDNVTSLSNGAGSLAQTYTLDSFGKTTASSGSLVNPFQFTSREFDTETNLYYFRERYYDPQPGRFLSEDPAWFDAGVNFYAYVRNNPIRFTDPSGLYTTSPEVPLPLPPDLDKFMKCMDGCTGKDQHVNATTNGKHADPGHAAGTTVDIRPVGTPSVGPNGIYCCAGKCGAPYLLDERKLHTKYGAGPHYHIQLVPPLHPSPKAPNSIPDTPECKPGKKCDDKNGAK